MHRNIQLSNEKIKSITSNAIRYFKECSFEALQNEGESLEFVDLYEAAIQKYPLAWTVLKRAAAVNGGKEEVFEKVQETGEQTIGEFDAKACKKMVCDGYSLEFDDYLKESLEHLVSDKTDLFYVDCFKGLTRNFEKVLHVLEIILQIDKAFVTCNYYISNGRIEKRRKILRACHYEKDMFVHLQNLSGLPPFFKNVLQRMR